MELKNLIFKHCHRHLAKSRYFKKKWIHRKTGALFDAKKATVFAIVMIKSDFFEDGKFVDIIGTENQILGALNDFSCLNSADILNLKKNNLKWAFFSSYFTGKLGEKILVREIKEKFVNDLSCSISDKLFYQELKMWACESGVELTFRNVRKNRKVIAVFPT